MASTKIPLELTAYAPDADGATLELQTTDTTVTDGSVLGKIEFKAPKEASGTDAILVGAAIEAVAEGTFAADNNATELVFKTGASEAATQKMVLTSAARLGINEASPDLTLHVNSGATNAVAKFESTDSIAVAQFKDNNGEAEIGAVGNDIGFYPAGAEKMRLDSSGNLGLGTTTTTGNSGHTNIFLGGTSNIISETAASADASLSISQNAYIDSDGSWEYRVTDEATNYYQNAGNHVWRYAASGSAGADISWSEAMRIDSSGNLIIPNSYSSVRRIYSSYQSEAFDTTTAGAAETETLSYYFPYMEHTSVFLRVYLTGASNHAYMYRLSVLNGYYGCTVQVLASYNNAGGTAYADSLTVGSTGSYNSRRLTVTFDAVSNVAPSDFTILAYYGTAGGT